MLEGEGAGKGDTYRSVDGEKFRANFDRIFNSSDDETVADKMNNEDDEKMFWHPV